MPIVSHDLQRRTRRFGEQRWLLDAVIKVLGPEWDQGRLHYYGLPCSPDHKGAFMGLQKLITKYDDIAPEMTKAARRFELRARAYVKQGHELSAGDAFFTAAVLYGAAQWPIFENTPFNLTLERKKTECYLEYSRRADHHVEAVEIPYQGHTLAGYLHLPPGQTKDERLPCLVMILGMDGFKELALDVRPLSAKIEVPYLMVAGEDDELSDIARTFAHLNQVSGPKTLLLYSGDLHGLGNARSSQLGPPCLVYLADWLADRAAGKLLESEYIAVDAGGQMHA